MHQKMDLQSSSLMLKMSIFFNRIVNNKYVLAVQYLRVLLICIQFFTDLGYTPLSVHNRGINIMEQCSNLINVSFATSKAGLDF